jgi:hypothetical protein
MNAADMTLLIASLTGPIFGPIGDRIKEAGARGYEWPLRAPEFYNMGLRRVQLSHMAMASSLAACELQRIVEIQNAKNAGGVMLGDEA